jgi:hypothetical protein
MAKRRKRKPTGPDNRPRYFLARKGYIQRFMADPLGDGVMRKCWPVAKTHEDAQRLIDFLKVREDGTRPAEFGTVPGETIEGHIEVAVEEGCEFIVMPNGWTEDGQPIQWGKIDMRE